MVKGANMSEEIKKKIAWHESWWFITLSVIVGLPMMVIAVSSSEFKNAFTKEFPAISSALNSFNYQSITPFLLGAIGTAIAVFYQGRYSKALEKKIQKEKGIHLAQENQLNTLQDFSVNQKLMGADKKQGIAIDESRGKICFIDYHQEEPKFRIFLHKDILSSEIYQDGISITQTSRTSQIGGALIGSILFGSTGAIIGGLSGQTKTTNKVNRIDLRITVNDIKAPSYDLAILNKEIDKQSAEYVEIINKLRHWHGMLDILIKRADNEDKTKEKDHSDGKNFSIADELKKLAELRDSGILSEEEFHYQKQQVLKPNIVIPKEKDICL